MSKASRRSLLLLIFLCLFTLSSSVFAQNPLPKATPSIASAASEFIPKIPPRAIAYQRERRTVSLIGLAWGLAGAFVFVKSGLSRTLAKRLETPKLPPPFWKFLLFFAAFTLFHSLWTLPFGLWGWRLERNYGFSTLSIFGYLRDRLIGTTTELILAPVLWIALRLYTRSPEHWWKKAWIGVVPLILFSIVLQPIVISPLYYRYTAMSPSPLRTRIETLASKAGISGGRILIESTSSRTTHVNAYVAGLGPTTRIVINDTALEKLPPDQLTAMMGHEMGHYVEGHLWFGFAFASLGAGLFLFLIHRVFPLLLKRYENFFGAKHPAELSALPLLLWIISVFLLVQAPVESGISRVMEHRADRFGLRVTGLHRATAQLFVGFAERDYSDPDPPTLLHFWFGTHPTLKERIEFALEDPDDIPAK